MGVPQASRANHLVWYTVAVHSVASATEANIKCNAAKDFGLTALGSQAEERSRA